MRISLIGVRRLYDLGPPVIACPSCGSPVRTGGDYWRNLSSTRRAEVVIAFVLLFAVGLPFISLMSALTIGMIAGLYGRSIILIAVVVWVILAFACYRAHFKRKPFIARLEREDDRA